MSLNELIEFNYIYMKDLINKFRDGHERYNTNPLLNAIIRQLSAGADPITIIDGLVDTIEEGQKRLLIALQKEPPRPYVLQLPGISFPMDLFVLRKVEEVDLSQNDGFFIAFVPGQGFQWSRYSDGSKTWQSCITLKTVEVSEVLVKITNNENNDNQ
jgi:hypothetical protein